MHLCKDSFTLLFCEMKVFIIIWFGQLVSIVGSGLTRFALGLWVYQRTGSVTQFALIALSSILPHLILSPLAGVLVDRWNRRWVMILSDLGAGFGTFLIAILFFTDQLLSGISILSWRLVQLSTRFSGRPILLRLHC